MRDTSSRLPVTDAAFRPRAKYRRDPPDLEMQTGEVHDLARCSVAAVSRGLEELFAVQDDVESLALLFLRHPQADDRVHDLE